MTKGNEPMRLPEQALAGLLDQAKQDGWAAELYYSASTSASVKVNAGRAEEQRTDHDYGIGIRMMKGRRCGFAAMTGIKSDTLADLFRSARQIAEISEPDPGNQLPGIAEAGRYETRQPQTERRIPPSLASSGTGPSLAGAGVGFSELTRVAAAAETLARERDSRIAAVKDTECSHTRFISRIMSTEGIDITGCGYYSYVQLLAVGEHDGDRQLGYDAAYSVTDRLPDPVLVAARAVEKVTRKLNPRSLNPGKYPLVLSPEITAALISSFMPAFSGEQVCKHKSIFANHLDAPIAGPVLTIIDDPFDPAGLCLLPFDGEGVAVRTKPIIERGILKTFLHNKYSAVKTGQPLTGNAQRGGYNSLPGIAPKQLSLPKGTMPLAGLLSGSASGIYVTEIMGLHTIDPVSGEYSIGIAGNLISGGALGPAVQKLTIAGNLRDLLRRITAVGDNVEYQVQGVSAPSLRLDAINVSG